MKELLIILWFNGYHMVLSNELLGFSSLEECYNNIPVILVEYKAHDGACYIGDILRRLEST